MENKHYRTQLWSTYLGHFFEHYDTALFGFLSVFLAPIIFPQDDPVTALILTYALIPLGMLARPFGALIFGYIGDAYGRNKALFFNLAGMSIVSACIALTPTYTQVGILAPVLFGLGRILQNFLSSGETMGGAIYLLEISPKKQHDWISSFYNASLLGGILFASAGVSLLAHYGYVNEGWRYLYLIGCFTGLFGLIIRSNLPLQSEKRNVINAKSFSDLFKILWLYRSNLLTIAITSGFSYANYIMALILMNGFIPLVTLVTKEEMMTLNTSLLILDLCSIPFFGWLSTKYSREYLMITASLLAVVFGVPLFLLLPQASIWGIVFIRIFLVLIGVAFFAPFHAWAQLQVPAVHKYLLISFGYAVGSQLLGGPTAMISLWVYKETGIVSSIVWYWCILGLMSVFTVARSLPAYRNKEIASSLT